MKHFLQITVLILITIFKVNAQCISPTPYGSAVISSCSSGTITTCNYGGEYSQLTLNTTGSFQFSSSIATDYLTFTDDLNNVLFFGTSPLNVTIPSIGNYRLHISKNSSCVTESVCRTTSYACAIPCSGPPTGGTTAASNSNVCGSQYITLSLTGSTIGSGLSYQWQSSPTGVSWTSISTFTNSTANPLVTTATYYRCILTCGTFTASSSSKLINNGAMPSGGTTVASSTTACSGTTINFSLTGTSAWPGLGHQWQSSPTGVTWSNLVGYTSSTMSQSVLTPTYYRCIKSCGTSTVASTPVYITVSVPITYASVPYYQSFDNTWQDGCGAAAHNIPTNTNWSSNPVTGENSWRRQDDGATASWASPFFGVVTPHSGSGCANFHSSGAPLHAKGDLDLLINMYQNAKYSISFYYINATGTDNLDVLLSTDAGTSFSIKGSYNTQTSWTKKTIIYNSPGTPSCVLRFRGNADNNNDDIGIDSLAITMFCVNPTITATASSTTICKGESITLTATGATNYTWTPSGSTNYTVVVTPTANTNYVVTGSNDGLCFPTANVTVSVTNCPAGIEELNANFATIFPNPIRDVITINFIKSVKTPVLEVYNAIGELILKQKLNPDFNVIDMKQVSNGIYFYKIYDNSLVIKNGKILKE